MARLNETLRDEIPALMNLFCLRGGDTIVDIGANAGLYTHSISRLRNLDPSLKIYSVEPNLSTFAWLSFRDRDKINFLNCDISDENDELEFVYGAVSHVFAAAFKRNNHHIPGKTTVVMARRLDDPFWSGHSLVLKIDVEGLDRRV